MPRESRRRQYCSNCESQLKGVFCHECGQSAFDYRVSLPVMVKDLALDYLNFNAKSFRSLGLILSKPGELTKQYFEGRRASFINPLRLYVVISIVFFLLARVGSGQILDDALDGWENYDESEEVEELGEVGDINEDEEIGQLEKAGKPPVELEAAKPDSILVDDRQRKKEELDQLMQELFTKVGEDPKYRKDLALRAFDYIPRSAFFLLPFFGLLLKLLYIRRKRYYSEHFIHALHLHSFAFILFGIRLVFSFIPTFVYPLVFVVYVILSMKKVYGQSWPRSLFKSFLLLLVYSFVLLLVVGLSFLLGGIYEAVSQEGYTIGEFFDVIMD